MFILGKYLEKSVAQVTPGGLVYGLNPLSKVSLQKSPTIQTSVSNHSDQIQSNSKKQELAKLIKLFNEDHKNGIAQILLAGFLDSSVQSHSKFLLETPNLDKRSIGNYIGEGIAFNIKVMHSFIDMIDFKDLPFVHALRNLLQTFRLPGEAQKIDRIMEKFADKYCENNPNIFAKADVAYTLGYSLLIFSVFSNNAKH